MAATVKRQFQIYIERPPDAVFAFLTDPKNWPRFCPEDAVETIASGPNSWEKGAQLTLTGGSLGNRTLEIVEWQAPSLFALRQVSGGFASFLHRRRLTPFQKGTLRTDQIEYVPAGGPLGALSDRLFLAKRVDENIQHEHAEAKRLLERIGRIKGPGG
jgi:uncharacterized membrane protein